MKSPKYRNKFERATGEHLEAKGIKPLYELERLKYFIEYEYIPDFEIKTQNGRGFYLETKGNGRSFDAHARRKMIAVKQQHPDIDLRILFYSNGKIGPKRKDGTCMRQADWAEKYGFQFSIGTIPEEWLEE